MKKTGLHGYVYDLSAYYDAIAVDDIIYLIKLNHMYKNFWVC